MATIAEKRAILYREWLLAKLANDKSYYYYTVAFGIPIGETEEGAMWDLEGGRYDDGIDDTIKVYLRAKKHYGAGGYYVKEEVIMDEDTALREAGYKNIPERIYKKHNRWDYKINKR